jgi:hypothetical protein
MQHPSRPHLHDGQDRVSILAPLCFPFLALTIFPSIIDLSSRILSCASCKYTAILQSSSSIYSCPCDRGMRVITMSVMVNMLDIPGAIWVQTVSHTNNGNNLVAENMSSSRLGYGISILLCFIAFIIPSCSESNNRPLSHKQYLE